MQILKRPKMRKIISSTSATLVLLMLLAGYATAANIYFYQAKTSGDYLISSGYSAFKDKLKENGHEINDLQAGLSRESLNQVNPEPDLLVIPNMGTDLTAEETTAIFEFVIKKGKGVLLCGATPSTNKLTIPLGMMTSTDLLEDDVNRVRDVATGLLVVDKTTFFIDLPSERPDLVISSLTRGVNTLDIFSAGGIYLFGNSKGVIFGGEGVNTPKALTFPKKSNPPLASYIQLGKGWVFLLSDPDMLSNNNLNSAKYRHDNLKFGVNIVEWLLQPATDPTLSEDEIDNIVRSLNTEIKDLNRTINYQETEKAQLNNQIITLTAEKDSLAEQVTNLSQNSFLGFKYEIWAMGVLSLCLLLTVGVVLKKNKKAAKMEKGDLGYEFDDKEFGAETDVGKGEGKIKEEDIEERLKELQKGSQ
jgi:hypothetical protein